jgi:acyl carrier protein
MDTAATTIERVTKLVYDTIDEVNPTLAPDRQVEKAPSTVLFGEGAMIDSLGLVSIVVGVEQRVIEELDANITIVNEKAMSLRNSPFRTIGVFADYVTALVEEAANA